MKKAFAVLIAIFCLCSLLVFPAQAATDPVAETLQANLGMLDRFYYYNFDYMIRVASDEFLSWNWDDDSMYKPVSVPAADFEAVLHKYFVLTDRQIQELRDYGNRDYNTEIWDEETWEVVEVIPFYNAETQIYTVTFYGGFGGSMPDRQYLGYVDNGSTYDVYYQHITYGYLCDVLPDGVSEYEYAESLGYPESIEYEGIVYYQDMDGYTAILSLDDYGRKYTVEMNGDVVRIISCVDYTASDLPSQFSDRTEVEVQIPENSGIVIPDNDNFPGGTVVSAETVTNETVTNAMASVAEKYVAYDFTATLDGQQIQPDGTLEVTFALPADFSTNVAVYYMADNGDLEAQTVTVDPETRTVTAQLTHFSIYILVDNASTVAHVHNYESTVIDPTCTENGHTQHVCACGESYVSDLVDATGHSYGEDYKCIHCGESSPAVPAPKPEEPTPSTPADNDNDSGEDCCSEEESEGNAGLIIGIVAAVVIIGGIVIFVIRKKK